MLKSGEKLRKLLMLLATWGLLLAFFIAYERYFVTGQREFLKEDGFRALTTLSGELNAQVQKAQKSTEAFIGLAAQDHKQEDLSEALRAFPHVYLRDARISDEAVQGIKRCSLTNPEDPASLIEIASGRDSLTLSISCHKDKPDHALYTVDLVKGLREAFEKQSSHFDDVLVADSSGNVIFQRSADPSLLKSSTKPQITNLKSLLTGSATAEPKKQDQESTRKKNDSEKTTKRENPDSDEKPAKKGKSANNPGKAQEQDSGSDRDDGIRRLIGASAFTEVTAAGKTYEMFSRPMRMALPFGQTWNLVVVGLWDAKQFDGRSREIPYDTLIWAALIVVALLSLSWPLFKLRYMSNTERFTAVDGCYLVLALFLAATSVMLMLLNASYTAHEQDKSDQGTEKLASLIKSDLKDEMDQAVSQLDKLSVPTALLQGDFLTQQDFLKGYSDFPYSSHEFPYPYFLSAFWADGDGKQRHKIDVRSAPTPISKIGFRPYFKRASSAKEHSAEDHYLEPILSINTDEFEVDLAGLFQHSGAIKVETLSLRPMSLVDPVLPPGYGFAVIDVDCNVLFHSDSYRNMREDFCEDSKDKDELKPWLFSGVDTPLDISYEGNTERAYLTSLESSRFALEASAADSNTTQAFLLVFRKPELALTLNLAVILVCSVLMGAYFVVLVALALLYFLVRGTKPWVYPPAFLWPQRKHAVAYLQIFVSNIVILLLFWWSYPSLYEAPLLALTLVVAVVSILLSAFKLRWPDWGPVVLGALLAAIAFVSWLLIPSRAARDPLDWEFVLLLLGASCLLAIFLADKVASTSHRKAPAWALRASEFAGKHFSKAYVLAVLSVITATGVVPCIGCFKYSYDAITELALKRDEIEVSERLINRQDRIKEYYSRTKLPEGNRVKLPDGAEGPLTERRMGEHWDRYDSHTFEVKKDSASNPCDTGEKHDQTLTRDDVNEVIEKWIAKATLTLTLPTNALGAQMSKLGVASTKDVENNWEHCWTEPAPTSFQLFWKSTSRWPHETVTATYPDWKGLRPWPQRFFLILLWVGLGFWIAIILKKSSSPILRMCCVLRRCIGHLSPPFNRTFW